MSAQEATTLEIISEPPRYEEIVVNENTRDILEELKRITHNAKKELKMLEPYKLAKQYLYPSINHIKDIANRGKSRYYLVKTKDVNNKLSFLNGHMEILCCLHKDRLFIYNQTIDVCCTDRFDKIIKHTKAKIPSIEISYEDLKKCMIDYAWYYGLDLIADGYNMYIDWSEHE